MMNFEEIRSEILGRSRITSKAVDIYRLIGSFIKLNGFEIK